MAEMNWQILQGDVRARIKEIPSRSVHCVVTSPPYFGLRDYGTARWEGGDPKCKHLMKDESRLRSLGGTPQTKQDTNQGTETFRFDSVCGKCGATKAEDLQIGLEQTPDEYVADLVEVFREVKRVLRDDGTAWLNLGDSYAGGGGYSPAAPSNKKRNEGGDWGGAMRPFSSAQGDARVKDAPGFVPRGLKPKDLMGIPWRVAFALQADGWYLRCDVVWQKPNAFPESVTDRPSRAHEYVFMLTKSERYFFDQEAVREPHTSIPPGETPIPYSATTQTQSEREGRPWVVSNRPPGYYGNVAGRNIRSVWTIVTQPYDEAHFATFPELLVTPCIKASTSEEGCCPKCGAQWERVIDDSSDVSDEPREPGDVRQTTGCYWTRTCEHRIDPVPSTVFDPFNGSGTTGVVALKYKRSYIGIELSPEYAEMARRRLADTMPLFSSEARATKEQQNVIDFSS